VPVGALIKWRGARWVSLSYGGRDQAAGWEMLQSSNSIVMACVSVRQAIAAAFNPRAAEFIAGLEHDYPFGVFLYSAFKGLNG